MAKQHKPEEHENHERWLVSYADFITLLFAFFVVMYSISAVNEGKFRVAARSIQQALHPLVQWESSTNPFEISEIPASPAPGVGSKGVKVTLAQKAHAALSKLIREGVLTTNQVSIATTDHGVVVTIMDSVLFESGRAQIRPEAYPLLQTLAEVLTDAAADMKELRVTGHTDNVPIHTLEFPSNWELSSLRAVMVLRVLTELYGVPADRMSAVGFGEFKPVAENLTPEGRARNRRVELVVRTEP